MFRKIQKKIGAIALIAAIASANSGNVLAATQGTVGNTSTGTALISITKSVQARISGISDMTLANWNVDMGAVTLYSDVCIYSSTGSYKVTASGSGLLGIFTVNTSLLNAIAYSVEWNDAGAGSLTSSGTNLIFNLPSGTFNNANNSSTDCSGGANKNARVIVKVSSLAMGLAPNSNDPYTGTLTMVVAPE